MAINRAVFKIVFVLSILLFLIFPGSAETGSFHWVGAATINSNEFTMSGSQGTSYLNSNSIYFVDQNTLESFQSVIEHNVTGIAITGGDGNTGVDTDVVFMSGSQVVGTGIFGYMKMPDGKYRIYIYHWQDWNVSGLSAPIRISITSSSIAFRNNPNYGTLSNSPYTSGTAVIEFVYNTVNGYRVPVGVTGYFETSVSYDYYNRYTYESYQNYNYLNLPRSDVNKSKAIIEIDSAEVKNESALTPTNLEWTDPYYLWNITMENQYGDIDYAQIDFNAIPLTPQTEDTILWGADSYVTGETGTASWSLSDSNFNSIIYKNEISIYQDVVDLEHLRYNTELPTQTGSLYFNFAGTGNYIAVLKQTNLILPTKIIDSDTVKVIPIGPSYISVNASTIFAGASFDINFSYGFAPSPTYLTGVNAKRLMPDNTFKTEKFWSVQPLFPISANTIYSLSDTGAILKLSQEGEYIFELVDFNKGSVAQTQLIDVIFIVQPPTHNITTSSISVDKEQYQMGETLTGFLKIDNTNFQNTCYLEYYNYDHEIVTNVPQPIFTQSTSFEGLLKTSNYDDDYIFAGVVATLPGSNAARIVAVEGSTRTVIAYDNFSVSTTNVYGYGLELSTYESCINEKINIIVTAPSAVNITIENPYGNLVKTFALNGSSTISYTFPTSGQYIIELYRSGEGVSQAQATIFINPDCAGESIVVPTDGDMNDMYKNIFGFMTLPAFWGIIIMIGFVGGLAMKTNRNGERIVSGNVLAFITFALINLFSIVGLFAPYTMYIVISTWIFAGIFFTLGKSLARGE